MSITLGNVDTSTGTFQNWVDKTNTLVEEFRTETVTTKANTVGAVTTGNAVVNGFFGANTFVVVTALRGGTALGTVAQMNVTSNVSVLSNTLMVTSNATINLAFVGQGTLAGTDKFTVFGNTLLQGYVQVDSTGAMLLPGGTTAQRPTAATKMARYNTDLLTLEFYNGTSWVSSGGGGSTNTQLLFNDSGQANGSANLTWIKTSSLLSIGNSTVNTTINSSVTIVSNAIAIKKTTASVALDVNGAIQATGDITAFASDSRLKVILGPIEDAAKKVGKLNGFIYKWNDKAVELGVSTNKRKRYVGVSAQDVEKVLPEAVKLAPFDNEKGKSISGKDYKTVQYEKLVPLLIEAIKELNYRIISLEMNKDCSCSCKG